jgi:hypothetical protein
VVLGFELGFMLAKQALYCLSHTSIHFALVIFGDEGLANCLPRQALNHDLPNLSLPSS